MSDEIKKTEQELIPEGDDSAGEQDYLDSLQSKIKKLKEKLKKCNEEKQEHLTGWQREKADFINYRRRQEEQLGEWLKAANAGLIKDLLPVLDALEAGIRNWELGVKNQEKSSMGEIKKQLLDILKQHALEEINAIGEKFNPEFHEAIEQVESDEEEGIIVEEMQKGYLLNGRVIRVAKVKVTKKI